MWKKCENLEEYTEEHYNNKEEMQIAEAPGRVFFRGVFTGILLSAVCIMVMLFVCNGTSVVVSGKDKTEGAKLLTDDVTIKKLQEIQNRIEASFLYEIDGEKLTTCLFKGLTVGLEDPYAAYYTADEVRTLTELNEGEYHGIGITVRKDDQTGRFWIESVYEGSPAFTAGLKKSDEILAVDGENTEGMQLSELVATIKQKETMLLRVKREEKELEVSVEVTEVEIPTVSWKILDEGIGYLKIAEFDKITVEQFENAMEQMKAQGMERLILDVRDNPGGILDVICDIMDDLLPEGLIVYTEDREGKRQEFTSDEKQIFDGPLAVLVNENSASASEIFAGSIQDYGLGPVIGTTTYGKGVVQRTYLLDDGSALKLTAEKYYTAGGQDIDGTGVTPDIIVENGQDSAKETDSDNTEEDQQLQKAMDYLNGVATGNYENAELLH